MAQKRLWSYLELLGRSIEARRGGIEKNGCGDCKHEQMCEIADRPVADIEAVEILHASTSYNPIS